MSTIFSRIFYLYLGPQSLVSGREIGNMTAAERSVVDPSQGLGHALILPIATRKIPRTRWQVVQLSPVSSRQHENLVTTSRALCPDKLAYTRVSFHYCHICWYLPGRSTHHWPILYLSFKNKIIYYVVSYYVISYLKKELAWIKYTTKVGILISRAIN